MGSGPNKFESRCGVLLLNMGGPSDLDQIQPYLSELFSDPAIIRMPLGKLYQKRLARFISKRRAAKVKERYAAIGGGSPVNRETEKQAAALAKILGAPVVFAMRYTDPRVAGAIAALAARGARRLVVIPLFPQFSKATSGSAIAEFKANNKSNLPYTIVEKHFDHPGFIDALAHELGKAMKNIEPGFSTRILFVAHSIPESYSRNGDPYIAQVQETVKAVAGRLNLKEIFSVAFQSRIGPVKWHGPSLEQALAQLRSEGVEQIVLQPVSFVSENLETLYDLDIEFKKKCLAAGIKNFIRVPCPSQSEIYMNALAELATTSSQPDKWENGNA
jgi:protoporphyrin/coproporphyrin ferrochelatase